jgi:TolB-like protein/DNA-binding winged helix-turn-helix (wHTH) protein/Flp pilus assembly protein TadD
MDPGTSADVSLFEKFRFDRRGGGLFYLSSGAPVAIGSRALDVLDVLIQHAGDLVLKDEILKAVWPRTTVDDSNLTVQIAALRRALHNDGPGASVIQTVPGRGYRFVGSVTANERRPTLLWPMPLENGHDPAGTPVTPVRPMDLVVPSSVTPRRLRRGPTILLIAVLLVAGAVSFFWWYSDAPAAPRLSFVVLPFTNLSDDRDQQYFADGVTDDLTTDLTRISGSFVISRNTAFTYKDKAVNAKQIGRELGVRYLLEGSVRRSGKQALVNVQLISAESGAHLWAERFESDIGDLLAMQNEITSRIGIALNDAVVGAEAARSATNPDAVDLFFRARAALSIRTPDSYAEAIDLLERAFALDPRFAPAQFRLVNTLTARVLDGMSIAVAADIARAESILAQASAVSPNIPGTHFARGQVLRAQRRYAEAIHEYETVISLNRNEVAAYGNLAQCKFYAGSLDGVIPLLEKAIRLSPRDPILSNWYNRIGIVHLVQSHTTEAIVWLEKARSANPALPGVHADLAAAYGTNGESARAATELAEARRLSGEPNRHASISRLRVARSFMAPNVRALYEATYDSGMRKAGLLEE